MADILADPSIFLVSFAVRSAGLPAVAGLQPGILSVALAFESVSVFNAVIPKFAHFANCPEESALRFS